MMDLFKKKGGMPWGHPARRPDELFWTHAAGAERIRR